MIWNYCIRRPVLTIVLFLVLAIFGLYGYYQMPVRESPDVDLPIVSVNVILPGAEPEVIETEIVEPLEEEINTVEGLKTLTSVAREQVGTITAEFELWRDIDIATQDVRDRVNRARRELPDDIEEPIVTKLDPDAFAIMWVALTGDERWDTVRMSNYADEVIKERLENLRGVGRVQIGGERRFAARVRIDPEKLAARHLTVVDVVGTIQRNNVDIPSGRITSSQREFLVKTHGQFSSPEPINDLIVTYRNEGPVRVGDVGQVVAGIENDRQIARFRGQPTVGLGIVKQSDANTVALARAVKQRIAELSRQFPPGLSYAIVYDSSEFIEEQTADLLFTIFLTGGLVTVIVLLFLRSGRGTFVVAMAIPASLLGGLACMYVLGFTINMLSMMALILAIGIVVDDAIVVLENTYRHIQEGEDPVPAARVGTTEVAFPSIANTLSLGAVFIPVAFTAGIIGRFFYEFSLTVAATVFVSTFTALTLSPMLCSRLLKSRDRNQGQGVSERIFISVERIYSRILKTAFKHKISTVAIAVTAFLLGLLALRGISTEFAPNVDRESFMIRFETPEGATLSETDQFARGIEKILTEEPVVEEYFMAIGLSGGGGPGKVNEGVMFVMLTDRQQRSRNQQQIMQDLRETFDGLPGGRVYALEISIMGPAGGAPIQVVLEHTSIDSLAERQQTVMNWMNTRKEFIGVNTDLKMNKPQVDITVKRDKASQMNISVAEISNTLRYLLGEPDITEIEQGSERYEVITEVVNKGQRIPDDLRQIYVRAANGSLVSLDNLVDLEEGIGPGEIHHFNRMRGATISASTPPDVALGDAVGRLRDYLDRNLPAGFNYEFTGEVQTFEESFRNLSITLTFAIIFIYLVLAAQFESFIHPFVILLTLPLALVGAFGALWLFGMAFGIIAFIGLIMLLGMVTKNSILLVDYTNVLRGRGRSLVEAAQEAARTRFRPVIMTTLSTALGITPIALGYGAGGEARAPMGVAVFWGLLIASGLTLLVIPVVYTLINQAQASLSRMVHGRR